MGADGATAGGGDAVRSEESVHGARLPAQRPDLALRHLLPRGLTRGPRALEAEALAAAGGIADEDEARVREIQDLFDDYDLDDDERNGFAAARPPTSEKETEGPGASKSPLQRP